MDVPDLLVKVPAAQASGRADTAGQYNPAGHSISEREVDPADRKMVAIIT